VTQPLTLDLVLDLLRFRFLPGRVVHSLVRGCGPNFLKEMAKVALDGNDGDGDVDVDLDNEAEQNVEQDAEQDLEASS